MNLLTKFLTSALIGLSTSGPTAYLAPSLSGSEGVIFSTKEDFSSSKDDKLQELYSREKEIYQKLKEELKKFGETLKGLSSSKEKARTEIVSSFSKIKGEEQELQSLYSESTSILERLGALNKWEYSDSLNKLKVEEVSKRLKFQNDSLKKVSGAMHGWGVSLANLICAIDQPHDSSCTGKVNQWVLQTSNSTTDSKNQEATQGTASGGGALDNLKRP